MHKNTDAKLYKVDFPVPDETLRRYREGYVLSPLHADTGADRVMMARARLLETIFVEFPTKENAQNFLAWVWPLAERFNPEAQVHDKEFRSEGWIPTGRILVTQGRALFQCYEYWTSAGYSSYTLMHESGFDSSEYTGTVLRDAGLSGLGFPAEPGDMGVLEVDDIGEEDTFTWEEMMETIELK